MKIKRGLRALITALFIVMTPLASAEDGPLDVGAYRGKVVVLDFWASWCVPCRRSFPWLNAMHAKYADDGLVIIGVNVDREHAEATRFLAEYPADFRIYFDSEGRYAAEYGVEAMPSSFVIGRDGQVRARHLGFKVQKQADYEAAIVDALREGSSE